MTPQQARNLCVRNLPPGEKSSLLTFISNLRISVLFKFIYNYRSAQFKSIGRTRLVIGVISLIQYGWSIHVFFTRGEFSKHCRFHLKINAHVSKFSLKVGSLVQFPVRVKTLSFVTPPAINKEGFALELPSLWSTRVQAESLLMMHPRKR